MHKLKLFFSALAVSAVLTGCGGGGGGSSAGPTYTGLTTPVAIDATNAETVGATSTEAAAEAITQDTATVATPFSPLGVSITSNDSNPYFNYMLADIAHTIASNTQSLNLPIASQTLTSTNLGGYPFCGGSITISDSFVSSVQNTDTLNGTMTFNNLCYSDAYLGQIIMNGSITFTETLTEFSIRYSNFRISDGTNSQTINMTITCDASLYSCSITADFIGSDGKTYRIANMTVSGSGTGPYNVTATFYHPDHGSVDMTATGITYDCSDGRPNAGSITFTGSTGSTGSITFRGDCTGYDGTWDDGDLSTGVFNGDWL